MGIENLLAQGVQIRPAGMERNALMQAQEFKDRQQKNALMQMQMQDVSQQRQLAIQQAQQKAIEAQELQRTRRGYLDSISPAMGPARPVDPAQAMLSGMKPDETKALMPPPKKQYVIGPGGNLLDDGGNPLFTAPFKPEAQKLPPVGELQTYRDTLPPGDPKRREVQAVIDNQTRPPKYAGGGSGGGGETAPKPPKPLPPGALKMQQESLDKIGIASSINADLAGIRQQIDTGKLDFGPVSNLINTGRNMAGVSSEQSRNFGSFKSTLERLRNESLRLNTGVQTDGDAQRAWNELFQNINDTKLVKQRLTEIEAINKRGADLQRLRVDSIRNEYGASPLDPTGYEQQPAAVGKAGAYGDAEKERRYQEWKAKQK